MQKVRTLRTALRLGIPRENVDIGLPTEPEQLIAHDIRDLILARSAELQVEGLGDVDRHTNSTPRTTVVPGRDRVDGHLGVREEHRNENATVKTVEFRTIR